MTVDEIEYIEEGRHRATIALLRRLAAALDSDVRLTPGHDLGSVFTTAYQRYWTPPAASTATPRTPER